MVVVLLLLHCDGWMTTQVGLMECSMFFESRFANLCACCGKDTASQRSAAVEVRKGLFTVVVVVVVVAVIVGAVVVVPSSSSLLVLSPSWPLLVVCPCVG